MRGPAQLPPPSADFRYADTAIGTFLDAMGLSKVDRAGHSSSGGRALSFAQEHRKGHVKLNDQLEARRVLCYLAQSARAGRDGPVLRSVAGYRPVSSATTGARAPAASAPNTK